MALHKTGNSTNVFNLNDLIQKIKDLDKYTPSKLVLQLPQLQECYNKGLWHLDQVQEAKSVWQLAVDSRQVLYQSIPTFATRIVGVMSGTNATPDAIKTARSSVNKLKGVRLYKPLKKDIPTPDDEEPNKERSISRASFDSRYELFADLVSLLSLTPGYDTTNAEFTLPALQQLQEQLLKANYDIDKAIAQINAARINRNTFLYAEETGLVDTALSAKKYIKGIYGPTSETFKNTNKIRFKNFR